MIAKTVIIFLCRFSLQSYSNGGKKIKSTFNFVGLSKILIEFLTKFHYVRQKNIIRKIFICLCK